MHVSYVGPHDEVEIAATGQTCARGESVEVNADLAKSLLEQEDAWSKTTKKSVSKTEEGA